jgi:hypothetical protein
MRKQRTLIFLFFSLFVCSFLNAQIQVKLHHPPPNKLKVVDLWYIDLDNTTQNTYTVYLHAEVTEATEGLIFRANSNNFQLPPGKKRIKKADIKEVKDVHYNKEYERYIKQHNQFPNGDYTICVYVINKETGDELGKDCIDHKVSKIGKIRLLSPKDGAVVKDYPLFTWTKPTGIPAGGEVEYQLTIVQMLKGQTKEEAIKSNPAWYEKKGIKRTNFKYPVSAKKLEKGKQYAWQVKLYLENLEISESEVFHVVAISSDEDEEWSLEPVSPHHGEPVETPNPDFIWKGFQLKNGEKPEVEYTLTIISQEGSTLRKRKDAYSYYKSWNEDSIKKYTYYKKGGIKDTLFTYPKDAPAFNKGDVYMWWIEMKYKNVVYHSDTSGYFPYRWTMCWYDFGDAPDVYGSSPSPYPTFKTPNGARHKWLCCGDGYIRIPYAPHDDGGPSPPEPDIQIKCLCCEWWSIERKKQAWLGPLPAGYTGTIPPPGPTWDCSDSVSVYPDKCEPANNGINFEIDSRLLHTAVDGYDDGVYFFPPICQYCCNQDSVHADVMVHTHWGFNKNNPLFLIGWMDWNGTGGWTAGENIGFTNVTPLWNTTTSPTILTGVPGTVIQIDPSTWGTDMDTCCAIYRLKFPCSWAGATTMWARFRLFVGYDSWSDVDFEGATISGEVEDYEIPCESIPPQPDSFDFGDAPDDGDCAATGMTSPNTYHYCSHRLDTRYSPPCANPLTPPWNARPPATHKLIDDEWLGDFASVDSCGSGVDREPDARTINLDNFDDGVKLPPTINECVIESVDVMINTSGIPARYTGSKYLYLYAWGDWTRDGDWDDTPLCPPPIGPVSEGITWLPSAKLFNPTLYPAGGVAITIPLGPDLKIDPTTDWSWFPNSKCAVYRLFFKTGKVHHPDSVKTDSIWFRFRLSYDNTGTGTGPNIASTYWDGVDYGEVEDYVVPFDTVPPQQQDSCDFGDAPDEADDPSFHYHSHNTHSGARHCNFNDEWLGNIFLPADTVCYCFGPSANAEPDANTIDLDNFDNGVDFSRFRLSPHNVCDIETVDVLVNTSGSSTRYTSGRKLHLHAWFDWNMDGDWEDTHNCHGTPADEHIYWLTAQPLCPPDGPYPPVPINNYDFKIDPLNPGLWPGFSDQKCNIFRLTFYAGDKEGQRVTDSLWCRFRLSYDNTGTGVNIADEYYGMVPFGEVEDFPLFCKCEIERIELDGIPVLPGSTVPVTPGSHTVNVFTNCGTAPICEVDRYFWEILETYSGVTEHGTGNPFAYLPSGGGTDKITVTITCPNGDTCNAMFYAEPSH